MLYVLEIKTNKMKLKRKSQSALSPSRISMWLLRRFPSSYCRFPLLGDLEEEFETRSHTHGLRQARKWYRRQAWRSLPALQKNLIYWSGAMVKNYLTTAFRNIKRHKGFSLMNISGLAVGMTCFMLMMLYIRHELNFDRFFDKYDRIYRVIRLYPGTGDRPEARIAGAPAPLAPTMVEEFPEVTASTRTGEVQGIFRIDKQTYYEDGLFGSPRTFG
jgi:putative ABC transport system permease protein